MNNPIAKHAWKFNKLKRIPNKKKKVEKWTAASTRKHM